MPEYEELKAELIEIAKLIQQYPSSLQDTVFKIVIEKYLGKSIAPEKEDVLLTLADDFENEDETKETNAKKSKRGKPKSRAVTEAYKVDPHLDLRGNDDIPPFRDFYQEKKPKSFQEVNAVAVYYLKRKLELETVTLTHAYTCYKDAGHKFPKSFKQTFQDTQRHNGWVTLNGEELDIPHRGVAFVENDLPRKQEKDEK